MRTLATLKAQVRLSVTTSLQYRADFLVDGAVELFWIAAAIYPLVVVFDRTESLGGWSFDAALIVAGVFAILQGVMEGLISPSLTGLVEQVRKGTFDFVLVKPVDSQLFVSFSKVQPWRCINALVGLGLVVRSLYRIGYVPSAYDLFATAVALTASIAFLYAFWLVAASTAFYVIRIDNITYLFSSVLDAARWPRSVFRGVMRLVFTFVIPLALMTSYPAEALLGRLEGTTLLASAAAGALALVVSRLLWKRAVNHYASASS